MKVSESNIEKKKLKEIQNWKDQKMIPSQVQIHYMLTKEIGIIQDNTVFHVHIAMKETSLTKGPAEDIVFTSTEETIFTPIEEEEVIEEKNQSHMTENKQCKYNKQSCQEVWKSG